MKKNMIEYNKVEITANTTDGINTLEKYFSNIIETSSESETEMTIYDDRVVFKHDDWDYASKFTASGKSMFGASDTNPRTMDTIYSKCGAVAKRTLTIIYEDKGSLAPISKLARKYPNLEFTLYKQSSNAPNFDEATGACYTRIYTYKHGLKYKPTHKVMAINEL